jgi:hypothetical protein
MTVFWDIKPYSLVELHRSVLPPLSGQSTSEMSVNLYQTTWRGNPEDSHPEHLLSEAFLLVYFALKLDLY